MIRRGQIYQVLSIRVCASKASHQKLSLQVVIKLMSNDRPYKKRPLEAEATLQQDSMAFRIFWSFDGSQIC